MFCIWLSLVNGISHLLEPVLTWSPTSLAHSRMHSLAPSLTHSRIYALAPSLTHSPPHSLTPSLTHSPPHSLTHSLRIVWCAELHRRSQLHDGGLQRGEGSDVCARLDVGYDVIYAHMAIIIRSHGFKGCRLSSIWACIYV